MVNLLVAAAVAAATPASTPAAPPTAEPAIFVVRDADTTVYLFGTFHALDAKAEWFHDQVRDTFESSDELVLETLIPEGPAKPGTPGAAPQPLRMPVATSASFLATTRMAINAGKSQGMQVGNGADMVLRRIAEAEGKPVEGLETLQSQLNMFSRLPSASPPRTAHAGDPVGGNASSMESLSKSMAEMQAAWKRGDQSVFVRMLGQIERASPDTYRMMFTERNAHFASWIAERMKQPGIIFVAIGAGHLAGKDSVLVRLAEHGIESARVN